MLSFRTGKIRMQKVTVVFKRNHPPFILEDINEKRVSSVTCLGSVSVEAALVLPFFIAAVIAVMFYMQAMQVEMRVQKALYNQMMKCSGVAYYLDVTDLSDTAEQMLEAEYIRSAVVDELGKSFIDSSYIVGGSSGIKVDLFTEANQGYIDVKLVYYLSVPYNLFRLKPVKFVTRMKNHTWVGNVDENEEKEIQVGYITSNGEVYHLYKDCSYIYHYILESNQSLINTLRNNSGGKYLPCNICCKNDVSAIVYYTKNGTRYHQRADCNNLHSNVFSIDLSMAKKQYRLCSKCKDRRG